MGIDNLTNQIIDEIIDRSIKLGLHVDDSNRYLYSEFLRRHYEKHEGVYDLDLRPSEHHNSNFIYRDLLCDSLILFSIMRAITPIGTSDEKEIYFDYPNSHLLAYKEMSRMDKGGVGIRLYERVNSRWRRFQPIKGLRDTVHNKSIRESPKVPSWKDLINDVGQDTMIVEQYGKPITSITTYG